MHRPRSLRDINISPVIMTAQLVDLAPGFSVYGPSPFETHFIYQEIFQSHCYDVAPLPDQPVIIDVGANIGLFALYIKKKYPTAKIIAFEPAPATFAVLRQNLKLHNIDNKDEIDCHQCALGSGTTETGTLTFFPNAPGNSTLVPEEKEKLIQAARMFMGDEAADMLVLGATKVEVPIRRLSDVLAQRHPDLKQIDLLKIDVEGAELEVLRGIDETHWPAIQNVVLEMQDSKADGLAALGELEGFLRAKGYRIERKDPDLSEQIRDTLNSAGVPMTGEAGQDESAPGVALYMVTARRGSPRKLMQIS